MSNESDESDESDEPNQASIPLRQSTTREEPAEQWKRLGQPWRTEPEIDPDRQVYLARCRRIDPDPQQGIYPFSAVQPPLTRADVEWLLATHENGRGPVDWTDEPQRRRDGLDLRGADLRNLSLLGLPLAGMRGGLTLFEWASTSEDKRDLASVRLEQAELSFAHLEGANLRGAYLEGAELRETHLETAYLVQAHMRGSDLSAAHLEGADLRDADLQGASLRDANLQHANLIGAHLEQARLQRAHLEGARLAEALLQNAHIQGTHLEGADLRGARLEGAYGVRLIQQRHPAETHLEEADLRSVHLEGADLHDAHLKSADLWGAHLEATDLHGSHLEGADLWGAYLEGAHLEGAHLERAYLDTAHLEGAHLVGAHLEEAELEEARLEGADLRGAYLQGANLRQAHLEGKQMPIQDCERVQRWDETFRGTLPPADLRGATFDYATDLAGTILEGGRGEDVTSGCVLLADVHWDDVNLNVVGITAKTVLGDERLALNPLDENGKPKDGPTRLVEYEAAVRANRQLAVALREQGLNERAKHFDYCAQELEQEVFRRKRQRGRYLFSRFLDVLTGYGYHMWRIIVAYLVAIGIFTALYFTLGFGCSAGGAPCDPHPLGLSGALVRLWDALVLSVTAFHGRVFSVSFDLGSLLGTATAVEAIVGLVIEGVFIAMLTKRFFER